MTRTERAVFPRAISKDRSESKSGLDKSVRKNGGGPHGWGKLEDERELENAALEDEQLDIAEDKVDSESSSEPKAPAIVRSVSSMSDEDIQTAKQFRTHAFQHDGLDLAAIARTSAAASTSPPNKSTLITSDANSAVSV